MRRRQMRTRSTHDSARHSLTRSLSLSLTRAQLASSKAAGKRQAGSVDAGAMYARGGGGREDAAVGRICDALPWVAWRRATGEKGSVTSQKRTAAKQSCNRVPAWWWLALFLSLSRSCLSSPVSRDRRYRRALGLLVPIPSLPPLSLSLPLT